MHGGKNEGKIEIIMRCVEDLEGVSLTQYSGPGH